MPTRFYIIAASLTLATGSAITVAAQQPRITNGRVSAQAAGTPLSESFRALAGAQAEAAWIGYRVPAVEGERTLCCSDSGTTFLSGSVVMVDSQNCCVACRLEPSVESSPPSGTSVSPPRGAIQLESSNLMTVLFRVVNREVERIRVFSYDCELDAGGRPVVWLENVRPADSIALLESMAQPATKSRDRVSDGAISAIALHRDAAADASLERLVASNQPESVRKKVTFWLGNTRGARGLELLRRVLREDPSMEVRKGAVFGVSQSREPGAIDELIQIARSHSEAGVRSQAIFWLGQKAGAKASAAITERIEQDPDTEVKKRAVFALSQFPKDEGVPLLIKVARTNTNPSVRKQAMFWLAQSRDPRAIDFFAEILK
jgi:HEAT repeats